MTSFSVVHNIPSPYRLHLFRILSEHLQAKNIEFHVHFMALGHKDRSHWQNKNETLPFPHTFWYDFGPTIHHKTWHFNPNMIRALVQKRTQYLLVGGPWDSLTGMFVSMFARRGVGIAWQEGNSSTPGRIVSWIGRLKRILLKQFDYIAVPGAEGERHLQMLFAGEQFSQQSVFLPNIVDETRFSPGWKPENQQVREQVRRKYAIDDATRLAIWPARFIPEKGILEFLPHLNSKLLEGWRILLIGQGSLETPIRDAIDRFKLNDVIHIQPHVSYEFVSSLYQASDLFLLPSVQDRNPLTVVEALHSGLPLLISNRVGNFPEAIDEGLNGWGFDPINNTCVQRAITAAFGANREQLLSMGEQSLKKAQHFWESHRTVGNFLDVVLQEKTYSTSNMHKQM